MLRTRTLILSTHENQEVGSQIHDILQRDESLIVRHFSGRLSDAKLAHNEKPQLLIAVAPTAKPETAAFSVNCVRSRSGPPFFMYSLPIY